MVSDSKYLLVGLARLAATTNTPERVRTSMSDDEPDVPVVCPECETSTRIPLSRVGESVERHNEQMHDGEEIAQVDPAIASEIQNLITEDLDLF